MANMRLTTATQNAGADAVVDRIDLNSPPGTIEIRSGTQPASANDAATGTLLAVLTFSNPAFGAASSGVATASTITSDTNADNTGTATWARIKQGGGTTVFDIDVGTSGASLNLNTTSIVAAGTVSITSFTVTQPAG
jgi:hypothetical protein